MPYLALDMRKALKLSGGILLFLIVSVAKADSLSDASNYDFRNSDAIADVYGDILKFRLTDARTGLNSISRSDPGNLFVPLLENYCDLIELFLSEDRELYESRKYLRSERLDLIKQGSESNPWYRFALAEVYLHWGTIRLKYGDYLSAAADVNRAFRLLKKNVEEFPEFGPSYKNLAVIKMVVGTIPDKYVWVVKLFSSLEGDVPEGFADLDRCIRLCRSDDLWLLQEAQIMRLQSLIYFENDLDAAWTYIGQLGLDPSDNELHAFIVVNTALKRGETDKAIGLLRERQRSPGVYPIYYLDMMLGKALLYKGSPDAAFYLKRFLREFRGINYIKEAYQKLAWDALLKGDESGYYAYMDSCVLRGESNVGEDKNALKEAKRHEAPQTDLLRVRLFFDGGYFDKANALLNKIERESLPGFYQLEYDYRRARVFHALDSLPQALEEYASIIREGADDPRYFACNAAFQSGLIYESMGKWRAAEHSFKQCLEIDPDDYQNSLHQKAKAGLHRLEALQ